MVLLYIWVCDCVYIYIYIYISIYTFLQTYNNAASLQSDDTTNLRNARSEDTSYIHLLFLFNMHYQNVKFYRVLIY